LPLVIRAVRGPEFLIQAKYFAVEFGLSREDRSVPIQTSKSETVWLVEDALLKSVRISSIEKVSIFLRNMPENSPPQYCHFTREIAFFRNLLDPFLADF